MDHIQIIKKVGGKLTDSYLDEGGWLISFGENSTYAKIKSHTGFILDKSIGTNCPKRVENARILIANTCVSSHITLNEKHSTTLAMDTDKIKIFGARMKVDGTGKLAELERAERVRTCYPHGRSGH